MMAQTQPQSARARRPSTSSCSMTHLSSHSHSHNNNNNHHNNKQIMKRFRGVRMRKWGKWVAEIRQPNKRTRIWLGSYSTPLAAAKAYDTAVFYLRGRSGRLNFPDEVAHDCDSDCATAHGGELSADLIRKKAAEVGARVDAVQASLAAEGHGHVKEESVNGCQIERDKRKLAWRASFDLNESPDLPDN